MKILFLSSGHPAIYNYWDEWTAFEFIKANVQCKMLKPSIQINELKEVVKSFKPDLMFIMSGIYVKNQIIRWFKNNTTAKVALWLTEDPFCIDQTYHLLSLCDYIFTGDIAAEEVYKKRIKDTPIYHLPLGTNPDILTPLETKDKAKTDLSLVGVPYGERIQLIHYLLKNNSCSIQVVGPLWEQYFPEKNRSNRLTVNSAWIPPREVCKYYHHSKIVLNPHKELQNRPIKNSFGLENKSINARTFDIAACGVFQLTSYKPDISHHFIEDKEIVSYKTNEELLEKIDYYLNHEEEREEIATNGRKRVLNSHTFAHRIQKVLSIIDKKS